MCSVASAAARVTVTGRLHAPATTGPGLVPESPPTASDPSVPAGAGMAFSRVRNSLSRSKTARALLHPAILVRRAFTQRFDAARNRMFENLQDCLAEDPVVQLKEFEGSFLVDRRSHLFMFVLFDGAYEPVLAAACVAHLDPQRDAIDVGANVGFYTNLMAKHLPSRRVLAIEPAASALAKLRSNMDRNAIGARTIVFEGAAADRVGTRTLHMVAGKEEYSSLG